MKKMKRALGLLFSIVLSVSAFMAFNSEKVEAYTTYNKLEIENMQLNKARIKKGSADSNGKHVEAYWQQDPLDSFDKLTDITFARTVLEAEEAGDYMLQIHCKNESGSSTITLKLYVNGTPYDINVSGDSYLTVNKTVAMKKGKNSVVLAWVNWGYFDYINYPSELKIVSQCADNKYHAFEAALNEIQLTPTTGFHNAESTLYTAPIEYNSGDEEWQGSATFTVDAAPNIRSVDLNYYVAEYENGFAQIAMSVNGGKEVKIDLSGTKVNSRLTYQISTKTLTDAGFLWGKTNTIKFRQASASGGKVGLYDIVLKKDVIEEETTPITKANRYEAESAYVISGGKIKKSESDSERWSKGSYVGEFTPTKITNPSQIDEYCSNVGYVQYQVKADKAGYYKITLGYATEKAQSVYVTSGYEWSKVNLTSTGSWDSEGEKFTYVYLKKGNNSIWVTGPTAEDGWVNYDYIDVVFDEAADINTKKTVLLLDNGTSGSNSKVVSGEEETTVKEENTDENGDNEEKESDSLTSPETGTSLGIMAVIVMLMLIGFAVTYKKGNTIKK